MVYNQHSIFTKSKEMDEKQILQGQQKMQYNGTEHKKIKESIGSGTEPYRLACKLFL